MPRAVKVVGVGDFTPSLSVSNETMARAIPGWSAELIREKTGILERRFVCEVDAERGRSVRPASGPRTNCDLAERALVDALSMAGVAANELDAVFLVTCTPDRPDFNHDAMELHRRLALRSGATALMINDGCGGTPYVLDLVHKLIAWGAMGTVAVVASNFASAFIDRRVYTGELEQAQGKKLSGYLSMYVFGDGAGAMILRADSTLGAEGILASTSGNAHQPLVLKRGGGAELPYLLPDSGAQPVDFAYVVNGLEVAKSYPVHMRACLEAVGGPKLEALAEVKRYYLHQPNKRVLDRFCSQAGLASAQVSSTVQSYGNTSAAGMLVGLSEDVKSGRVALGSGDLVCIAAAGANVHYGAQLIRL
jgi:3-oxoacyl-[acyl-carrier-protein] synthase-3